MAEGEGSLRLFPGPKLRGSSNSYSYVLQFIVCILSGNIFPTIMLHHRVCSRSFRECNLSVQSLISFLLLRCRSWKHLLFVNLVIQLFLFEPDLFFLSGRLCRKWHCCSFLASVWVDVPQVTSLKLFIPTDIWLRNHEARQLLREVMDGWDWYLHIKPQRKPSQ